MDADPLKITGRTTYELHPTLERPSVRLGFGLLPYLAAAGIAVSLLLHKAVPLLLIVLISVPLIAKFVHGIVAKNNFSALWTVPAVMLLIGFANLTAAAYSEGFRFRHRSPEYFAGSYPACENGNVVLFSTGDRFVGVRRSGERLLLDEKCVGLMRFPPSSVMLDVL